MMNTRRPSTCYLDFLVILELLVDSVLKYHLKCNFSSSKNILDDITEWIYRYYVIKKWFIWACWWYCRRIIDWHWWRWGCWFMHKYWIDHHYRHSRSGHFGQFKWIWVHVNWRKSETRTMNWFRHWTSTGRRFWDFKIGFISFFGASVFCFVDR